MSNTENMMVLSDKVAISLGFSEDREKRKQQHLDIADSFMKKEKFSDSYSTKGATFLEIAKWHKLQADNL